jgi:hypothetical protein
MTDDPQEIQLVKQNPAGQQTYRYHGRLLERSAERLVIEAFFTRHDMDFNGLLLGKGDRFVETYYTDRWYNIYEVHAREDDAIRGWYCNISFPAEFDGACLSYRDLCLDLLVFPDGRQIVLDEDEFALLDIPPALRQRALDALSELQALAANTGLTLNKTC